MPPTLYPVGPPTVAPSALPTPWWTARPPWRPPCWHNCTHQGECVASRNKFTRCDCHAGFTGKHCSQSIRVDEANVAIIELVWGLKGLSIPRTPIGEFFGAFGIDPAIFTFTMGDVDYQPIDLTDVDAQRAVLDTCTAAVDDPSLRVLPGRTYCFLNLFDEWLQRERGAQLPLRNNFTELLSEYLDTSEGEALNSYVGYDCDQRVTWVVAKFITDIDEDADNLEGPGTLLKYQRRWERSSRAGPRPRPRPGASCRAASCGCNGLCWTSS